MKTRLSESEKQERIDAMPFFPKNLNIEFVSSGNFYMRKAKEVAEKHSLDPEHRTGAVVYNVDKGTANGSIIGIGANGSELHAKSGCERKRRGSKTGEDYELCEGCQPHNHAEQKAIANALWNGNKEKMKGAVLFLWGHYYACESCCNAMKQVGIDTIHIEQNE